MVAGLRSFAEEFRHISPMAILADVFILYHLRCRGTTTLTLRKGKIWEWNAAPRAKEPGAVGCDGNTEPCRERTVLVQAGVRFSGDG